MVSRTGSIRAIRRDERGNTGIIFALAFIPSVVMAGGAVDYGNVLAEQAVLQVAVDAAAEAANAPVEMSRADREALAVRIFNANVAGSQVAGVIATPDASNPSSVVVEASKNVPTPFLSLVNIPTMRAFASATASSTGEIVSEDGGSGKVCILALDPNSADGIHLQGGNIVNYADCWAHTNSTTPTAINANGSNAKANGKGHSAVGGWTQSHDTFTPLPVGGRVTVPDPFATVGAYGNGTYTPKFTPPSKASSCKANNLNLKKGVFTLDPGRYCGGINIQAHATVTFNPGVYYIDNGIFNVQSGSSVMGSNVLFYLEGAASRMQVIGGGTVDLSGRTTTASYAGFLVIAHPNANPMGESNIQGGGTFKLQGMIYMPMQRIEVSGNGDVNNATVSVFGMVAKDFYFRGNGVFNAKKHGGSGDVPDIMPNMPNGSQLRKTVLQN